LIRKRALVGFSTSPIRAKWRSCSSAWGSVVATCLTPPTLSETPVLPTIFNTCWYSVGVSCALAACVTTAMMVAHRRMLNIVVLLIALIVPPYSQKFVAAFTVRLPQIIEVGHRVRFCPKTYFAGIFEGIVTGLNLLITVVVASDLVTTRSSYHSPDVTLRFAPANWLRRPFTT